MSRDLLTAAVVELGADAEVMRERVRAYFRYQLGDAIARLQDDSEPLAEVLIESLIPADGFYEWKKVLSGKIPYSIAMKDDSPLVLAGLWEVWKPPGNKEWIRTCTIITGEPYKADFGPNTSLFCPPKRKTKRRLTRSGPC